MGEISEGFGVLSTRDLADRGLTKSRIATQVSQGSLQRLRVGWFAAVDHDSDVAAAVAAGGCLSCLAALDKYGVWVAPQWLRKTHVRKVRRPSPCWPGRELPIRRPVDGPVVALACVARCAPPEVLVAVTDSALRMGLIELDDLRTAVNARSRSVLARCNPLAESGGESLVRFRLQSAGIHCRCQALIPTVGRVDLLVGRCLIIDIDGRAYHAGAAEFDLDRQRDLAAAALGYRTIRLSYSTVMSDWDRAFADIRTLIRQGVHRRQPRVPAQFPIYGEAVAI